MSFNTYGQKKRTGTAEYAVWAEVNGRKSGGGTVDGFGDMPVGTVIPAGTPVHLDKSGGTIKVLKTYRVASDVSNDTAVSINAIDGIPAKDSFVAVLSDITGSGTGLKVSAVASEDDGEVELTLGAAVTLKAGAVLVEVDKAGTGAVATVIPNGLIWNDIVKEEGDTVATGAVVDVGRVYADRTPPISQAIKNHLVTIKFEEGL